VQLSVANSHKVVVALTIFFVSYVVGEGNHYRTTCYYLKQYHSKMQMQEDGRGVAGNSAPFGDRWNR
jgi:hypothetical protein